MYEEKKTGRIIFSNIRCDEQLASYLRNVLSRATKSRCLYHYTSVTSLKGIADSNFFLLNKPSGMNDRAEADNIRDRGLADNLFYSCFTLATESAELWNMYSSVNDGCMLEISFDLAKRMLEYPVFEFDSDIYNKYFGKQLDSKPSFNSIAYYWDEMNGTKPLTCMTVYNRGYKEFNSTSQIAGMVKSAFWRFENEVRLILNSDVELPLAEKVGLMLCEDFWKNCRVVISPFVTKEKNDELKSFCIANGIKCAESKYSGSLNFDKELFNSSETKKWIATRFNKILKEESGCESCPEIDGDFVAKLVVDKLNGWRYAFSSLKEYEDSLQDEMCLILSFLKPDVVKGFVGEVINHLIV